MKDNELKTKAAGPYSLAAALDAQRRNSNNMCLFTEAQRNLAILASDLIDLAYKFEKKYISYRKRFIAIKITEPMVKDNRSKRLMDKIFEERGYSKVHSEQGIIYRIPITVQE